MKEFWAGIKKWKYDLLIVGLYSFTITFMIMNFKHLVDIKIHNFILIDYLDAGSFPIPPGYYGLIYLVDLVARFRHPFVLSSILVLTLFLWWKYRIVFNFFKTQIDLTNTKLFLLSISVIFLGPIYLPGIDEGLWYLGKFTPTIWHNSTTIAVFPFSILLCFQTLQWSEDQSPNRIYKIIAMGLVLLLIKPSFLFCFVPALPVYIFIKERRFSPMLWKSILIMLIFIALILLEKHLIFTWDPIREKLYDPDEISQIIISPFKIWLHYSHQPILDLLSSIPLLICFLLLWRKTAFEDSMFTFTFILLMFSFIVYFLFSETGFRQYHANFYWQIPIALFLNYMSILSIILKDYRSQSNLFTFNTKFLVAVYLLQVVFGFAYWVRIFAFETLI
ncbi:hypothetical protein [Algoriphagus aquimarinus]|uniref:DUF2029 domain-containing protein n=1 Tax=Algoriphagus aquimarinus TaxID=237018 RepID=A0A5C7AJB1_9BACT|nr:hypothetical protein [Algoriphagus aquimarinus]TXE08810.1 hypothetical protein ESV85_14710 [Algoriphagus aquimarinus]